MGRPGADQGRSVLLIVAECALAVVAVAALVVAVDRHLPGSDSMVDVGTRSASQASDGGSAANAESWTKPSPSASASEDVAGSVESASPGGAPSATPKPAKTPRAPATAPSPALEQPDLARRAEAAATWATATFRIASFNILGHSHTAKGGGHSGRGYPSGPVRMEGAIDTLLSSEVSVAGLQELQGPQMDVLERRMPGWGVFPGRSMGQGVMANSIIWDEGQWQAVETHTIDIPYFAGRPLAMPYVLLKHRETGLRVWVANFHNPANVHGPAQQWRDEAVRRQASLATRLQERGLPVLMTGDFNDRERFYCPITSQSTLRAANGGTASPCRPPAKMSVDWIVGAGNDLSFVGYHQLDGGAIDKITDHPVILADVQGTSLAG